MPRILAVAQTSELGGAELALLRIARRLPERGFTVRLATPAPGPLATAAAEAGIESHRLPVGGLGRGSWGGAARGVPMARALVRRLAPDIVYLNGAVTMRLWPGLAGTTAVPHLHDLLERTPRPWRRARFWRSVPLVLCAAGAVAQAAAAVGAPRERLRNVMTPIEPARRGPRPAWAGGGPTVGYVGRVEAEKGVLDLLRAAPAVLDRRPDARLVIVGGDELAGAGDYRREVDRAAAALGDRVVMAGPVAAAHELMPWFDVLAVPSLRESFGTAAAEALAAGTPAVVTASGGMPEYVQDGVCGAIVAPGDPHALGAALVRVLERAPAMAEAAREAAAPFRADRVTGQVADALREALAARSRGT